MLMAKCTFVYFLTTSRHNINYIEHLILMNFLHRACVQWKQQPSIVTAGMSFRRTLQTALSLSSVIRFTDSVLGSDSHTAFIRAL